MKQSFAILRRDLLRVARNSSAWVVVFGMIFLPPLYAWFNIIGFWDPYGNTHNIHVAIVNEDRGAKTDVMGSIDLGDQIVTKLKANKLLGWEFVSHDTAMDQVKSGKSYAAIVIPKDFSTRVSGIISGNGRRPQLLYYVNEKPNGIAAKVTDTGAETVDQQVNDTFVSTTSSVVSNAVNSAGKNLGDTVNAKSNGTVTTLRTVEHNIDSMRSTIGDLERQLRSTPQHTENARQTIAEVSDTGDRAARDFRSTSGLITETQTGLNRFIESSATTLGQSSSTLSQASSQANLSISAVAAQLSQANGNVRSALDAANTVNTANEQLIGQLDTTIANVRDSPLPEPTKQDLINSLTAVKTKLENQNSDLRASIDGLTKLNTDTGSTITNTANSANAIDKATRTTLSNTDTTRRTIVSGALPRLNTGLSTLSASSAGLGTILTNQSSTISQAYIVLHQLDQASSASLTALTSTDRGLNQLRTKLDNLATDLTALSSSNALDRYIGKDGKLNVSSIADFMLSPTVLNTKVLYPVGSYGSGMAPLFTNLALWVGAFVLVVIMKLEVDTEGIAYSSITERYWGRWMLLAIIAAFQGLVTTVGELIIGVRPANATMFVLTGIIASLVYISITYALSTTFLHVGKGLCVALIILQIPGSSGLYPIEMMPHFFRAVYPLFPFTYSMAALRETIGGFYGDHWSTSILKLLGFAVLFFILGLVARPHLITLNRLFAKEIKASDMIIGEPVLEQGHEYQVSQAIEVLTDKDEYRRSIEQRAASFLSLYPRLLRGALIAGIIVPAAMAITFSLTNGTKLVALAAWIIWVLVIMAFLMAVELMRDSFERQRKLGTLSNDTIRNLIVDYSLPRRYASRHHGSHAAPRNILTPVAKHAETAPPDSEQTQQIPTLSDNNHEGGPTL